MNLVLVPSLFKWIIRESLFTIGMLYLRVTVLFSLHDTCSTPPPQPDFVLRTHWFIKPYLFLYSHTSLVDDDVCLMVHFCMKSFALRFIQLFGLNRTNKQRICTCLIKN